MFYWLIKGLFWPLARFYFRMDVRGRENVPENGAALLAANHSSYLDSPCLGSACHRKIHFMIKRRFYDKFMQGWFYRWMETIPVRESEADLDALRSAIRALEDGSIVGIFPEGTIYRGRELKWMHGASFLAAKSESPAIPVAIIGADRALSHRGIFPKPIKIKVLFGKPLQFPKGEDGRIKKEDIASFSHAILKAINELKESESKIRELEK
ncbi:MAG: lysophospholipid acyltransferase family protein [Acidobacteriota bacterium]